MGNCTALLSLRNYARLLDLMRRLALALITSPATIYRGARASPRRTKRIIKVSLTLTLALGLTLPGALADFYGPNPFLIGTVAIYLFPIKTVGGQFVSAFVGLSGALLGIAYANFSLTLAGLVQSEGAERICVARRVVLWAALLVGAFACGYARSRVPRSYLAINFFMVVNMFTLIRGIDHFGAQFHAFFYVMLFGACASVVVCFLWPEDRGGMLRADTLDALRESRRVLERCRHFMKTGVCEEVDLGGIKAAEAKLAESLHEANYEISLARIDSVSLLPFQSCVERMTAIARVFNASMRRRNSAALARRARGRSRSRSQSQSVRSACYSIGINSDTTRQAMDRAFTLAIGVLDAATTRIDGICRGDAAPAVRMDKFSEAILTIYGSTNSDVRTRTIGGLRELDDAAFTDQVNTTILDMFSVVKDMGATISAIAPQRRLRLIRPRMLSCAPPSDAADPTPEEAPSGASSLSMRNRPAMLDDDAYLLFHQDATRTRRLWARFCTRFLHFRRSRHVRYAMKFATVMGVLAAPAFVSDWYVWFEKLRAQWAMISAMVAMETTRGISFRTAGMKLAGALLGGLAAFVVMEASRRQLGAVLAQTAAVGVAVGALVTHARLAKAGTVCALAFNIVLGVAYVFPEQGPLSAAFARRLLTLPVGVVAVVAVHLTLFPFHSRPALVRGLCAALDWLHHLLFTIEAAAVRPRLQTKFEALAAKAAERVRFARALLPATNYEVSLVGHWPYDRFETLMDSIVDVMVLISGETPGDPVLAFHLDGGRVAEDVRTKLLASLCNDLLVISHTLSARLFMPRNESQSAYVLEDYRTLLCAQAAESAEGTPKRNYCDVGRLADLVHEMSVLRDQVDELTTEACLPRTGLLPEICSIAMSRPDRRRSRSRDTGKQELDV